MILLILSCSLLGDGCGSGDRVFVHQLEDSQLLQSTCTLTQITPDGCANELMMMMMMMMVGTLRGSPGHGV